MASVFLDKIYYCSPIFFQNFMIFMYGRKLLAQRYGTEYEVAFKHFMAKKYDSLPSEIAVQASELRQLIQHAKKNSPDNDTGNH